MQALLRPFYDKRMMEIIGDPKPMNRELVMGTNKPFTIATIEEHHALIQALIGFKGIRNPRAFKEAFMALDASTSGLQNL